MRDTVDMIALTPCQLIEIKRDAVDAYKRKMLIKAARKRKQMVKRIIGNIAVFSIIFLFPVAMFLWWLAFGYF